MKNNWHFKMKISCWNYFGYLWLLCLIFSVNITNAQFNNNFWVFGDSVELSWNSTSGIAHFKYPINVRGGVSSIADCTGIICSAFRSDLNIPVNGVSLNKYNLLMTNGDFLYGGGWYHERIILPDPGNDSILYIFTSAVTSSSPYGLYYSTANYKFNNDSGIVIQKNVQLNNFAAFDGLMAVRHGNGRDWWLVFQRWFPPNGTTLTNEYYFYLINEAGINGPYIQNIGLGHGTNLGQLIFNKDGNKFVQVSIRGLIQICDFDRCTGQIINCDSIQPEGPGPSYPLVLTSCAFSPNERFLYVCEASLTTLPSTIWQYDLTAANIVNSKVAIGTFNDPDMGVWSMLLAPDNKIYITATDESYGWPYPDTLFTTINSNLSVINQPDSLGLACDFQPFSFYLGGARTYYGLPNNPNYELGAWVGSPCDTLSVGLPPPAAAAPFFQAWYNPEWDMVHVNASGLKGSKGSLRVFDTEGRIVYEKNIAVIPGGYVATEIPTNNFASGIYIVSLVTEKETLSYKLGKL